MKPLLCAIPAPQICVRSYGTSQVKEQAIQIAEADVRIGRATELWQRLGRRYRCQVALWSYEDDPIGGLNHACLDCLRPHHFGCGRTWRLLLTTLKQ